MSKERQKEYYAAFASGFTATEDIEGISWDVRNVPTPFVGTGPTPGHEQNSYVNALQFRDRRELALPKPVGTYRIFITGGSTAYGVGAPSQEATIGAYLERSLNEVQTALGRGRFEVFTFANPAWSSTHERIAIENRLSELEPDLVISFSGNNDVFWGHDGRDVLWFRTFKDEYFWSLLTEAYKLAGQPAMHDVVTKIADPVDLTQVANRIEKNVRVASYALRLKGASYCFMLQPTLSVTKKVLTNREKTFIRPEASYYIDAYREIDSHLRSIEDANFSYFNLSAVFDGYDPASEVFLDSFHFRELGSRLIAKAMLDRLTSAHGALAATTH